MREETDMTKKLNKPELLFFIKMSFIFGLLAHAYIFFNYLPSHDALNAVYASPVEDQLKFYTGRFCIPFLRKLFGPLVLPWVVGAVSLLLVGVSAYLVCVILNINKKFYCASVVAFMSTNLTMTAMYATYSHEMIYDMLALFLACYAAYAICNKCVWGGVFTGGVMCRNHSRIIPSLYICNDHFDFISSHIVVDEWRGMERDLCIRV